MGPLGLRATIAPFERTFRFEFQGSPSAPRNKSINQPSLSNITCAGNLYIVQRLEASVKTLGNIRRRDVLRGERDKSLRHLYTKDDCLPYFMILSVDLVKTKRLQISHPSDYQGHHRRRGRQQCQKLPLINNCLSVPSCSSRVA